MIKSSKNRSLLLILLIIFSVLFWYIIWEKGYIKTTLNQNIIQNNQNSNENIQIWDKNISLNLFNEAYKIISDNYYSFSNISKEDLVGWMIKWVVWSLND